MKKIASLKEKRGLIKKLLQRSPSFLPNKRSENLFCFEEYRREVSPQIRIKERVLRVETPKGILLNSYSITELYEDLSSMNCMFIKGKMISLDILKGGKL